MSTTSGGVASRLRSRTVDLSSAESLESEVHAVGKRKAQQKADTALETERGQQKSNAKPPLHLPAALLAKVWPTERMVLGIRVSKEIRAALLSQGIKADLVSSQRPGSKRLAESLKCFNKCGIALKWTFNVQKQFEVLLSGIRLAHQELGGHLHLVLLNLCLVGVGGSRAQQTAELLGMCSELQHLNLSYGWLCEEGATAISSPLRACSSLKHLDLGANTLRSSGIEALVPALEQMRALETLILENNEFGDRGLAALVGPLSKCSRLVHLNLSQNKLNPDRFYGAHNPDGPQHLGPLLASCSGLTTLELCHDRLNPAAMQTLSSALTKCSALSSLALGGCQIREEGMQFLAPALGSLRGLKRLDLFANKLGSGGATQLAAALRPCTRLESLELANNSIEQDGVEALMRLLDGCSKLQHLRTSWSNLLGEPRVSACQR